MYPGRRQRHRNSEEKYTFTTVLFKTIDLKIHNHEKILGGKHISLQLTGCSLTSVILWFMELVPPRGSTEEPMFSSVCNVNRRYYSLNSSKFCMRL